MAQAEKIPAREYRSYGDFSERLRVVPRDPQINSHYPAAMAEKAYRSLHLGFVAIPLVAGIDKFAGEMVDWSAYLAPVFPSALGVSPGTFMSGVGVFEILVGIGMILRPRIFADIFALWIGAIVVNLVIQGLFFDVALFNFGLAAGACALARLSQAKEIDAKWAAGEAKVRLAR